MINTYKIKNFIIKHFLNPGLKLSDTDFIKFHNDLCYINANSKANVDNKMLQNYSLEEKKKYFESIIVAILYERNEPIAFLISPILSHSKYPVLHCGLIVVYKNPKSDLITMLGAGNYIIMSKLYGRFYTTNISSTPSIVESFTNSVPYSWPNPNSNLKKVPHDFKEVLVSLYDQYLMKYFPSPESISIDYKRFVMRSNSSDMGFNTDFYSVSKSKNIKYLIFCRMWLNYEKEEDFIQVGVCRKRDMFKIRMFHYLLRFQLLFYKEGIDSKAEDKKITKAA